MRTVSDVERLEFVEFVRFLVRHGASDEFLDWLGSLFPEDESPESVWKFCPRGDWLMWWLSVLHGFEAETTQVGYLAADRAVRVHTPVLLRLAGLESLAVKLETLTPVTDESTAQAASLVLEATYADCEPALDGLNPFSESEADRALRWRVGAAQSALGTAKEALILARCSGEKLTLSLSARVATLTVDSDVERWFKIYRAELEFYTQPIRALVSWDRVEARLNRVLECSKEVRCLKHELEYERGLKNRK